MRRTRFLLRTLSALFVTLAAAGCADAPQALVEPHLENAAKRDLQKVSGPIPAFRVEATIGPAGGTLGVPGYTLSVPRGAVAAPTHFTFESLQTGYVEVRLTATSPGSEVVNDVGSRGFAVPVSLAFSYEPAGGMPQWARLVVVRVRDDGVLERVPSTLDPRARQVVGRLGHFSQYAVAGD